MKRETRTKAARSKTLEHEREKAPTRARPMPLLALSTEEREKLIRFEHGAAELHLKEAIAILEWGDAPNACIHSAYYGMYHAATGVLHIAGGVGKTKHVPRSQEHVLQHFTKLAEAAGEKGLEAAQLLNRARSARMTADYGGVEPPDEDEVKDAVADARRFIDICIEFFALEKLGLPAASIPHQIL